MNEIGKFLHGKCFNRYRTNWRWKCHFLCPYETIRYGILSVSMINWKFHGKCIKRILYAGINFKLIIWLKCRHNHLPSEGEYMLQIKIHEWKIKPKMEISPKWFAIVYLSCYGKFLCMAQVFCMANVIKFIQCHSFRFNPFSMHARALVHKFRQNEFKIKNGWYWVTKSKKKMCSF